MRSSRTGRWCSSSWNRHHHRRERSRSWCSSSWSPEPWSWYQAASWSSWSPEPWSSSTRLRRGRRRTRLGRGRASATTAADAEAHREDAVGHTVGAVGIQVGQMMSADLRHPRRQIHHTERAAPLAGIDVVGNVTRRSRAREDVARCVEELDLPHLGALVHAGTRRVGVPRRSVGDAPCAGGQYRRDGRRELDLGVVTVEVDELDRRVEGVRLAGATRRRRGGGTTRCRRGGSAGRGGRRGRGRGAAATTSTNAKATASGGERLAVRAGAGLHDAIPTVAERSRDHELDLAAGRVRAGVDDHRGAAGDRNERDRERLRRVENTEQRPVDRSASLRRDRHAVGAPTAGEPDDDRDHTDARTVRRRHGDVVGALGVVGRDRDIGAEEPIRVGDRRCEHDGRTAELGDADGDRVASRREAGDDHRLARRGAGDVDGQIARDVVVAGPLGPRGDTGDGAVDARCCGRLRGERCDDEDDSKEPADGSTHALHSHLAPIELTRGDTSQPPRAVPRAQVWLKSIDKSIPKPAFSATGLICSRSE